MGNVKYINAMQDLLVIQVDRSTLEKYLQVEREIAEEEQNNPIQPLELKSNQLVKLTNEIEALEASLEELQLQTEKEKADVDMLENSDGDLKSTLLEMGNTFDDQMAKEKAEYLAALNKQEIAERELETQKKTRDQVAEEVAELETRAQKLHDLYKQHDNLLDRLFGGEYGSVLENTLEAELDELEAHRGRIMEANFKWRQAQMMLEYACKQLAVAVQKWQDLPAIPSIDLEIRYSVAAETRNNLVAAGQNITGAQRYLDNVTFPYCAPSEVETLNKQATEYVFTDMQSNDRHQHAQTCYTTTHKRASALLQWFDSVINSTIMKDLNDINEKVKIKTLALRQERVRLIQAKVKELWGTDIELDSTLRTHDLDLEAYSRAMVTEGDVVKIEGSELESERAGTPPPLSEDELAPVPSNNIIFGNMYDHYQSQLEGLAKQHQEEMEQFMREQESNTQKINANLQDKLMSRRQRRARMRVEEAQKNALTAG
ncbi:myosin-14 [Palaemon carinicauda]|uniref:myosin-14 n=1 Tax=Palaemon carinicauda TaxID=392227 RepID=UPI0035B65288